VVAAAQRPGQPSRLAGVSEWFDELAEFLRIPSISADPAHRADVTRAGEWVCGAVRSAGGDCELLDWNGQPLAVGQIPASTNGDGAPTVLCYGHFDVQPPDPLALWESPPFEPEIRDEYLYGRGVADDKGQLFMLLSAARELAQAGRLPVNVRFACDGEEETGGHSIVDFLGRDERGADAAIIFDSGMIRRGLPAFNVATRGLAYFHLTVRTGARDLHSGLYGGAALNAAHALTQTLTAALAVDGRLPEPLRAGTQPPSREELESWQELPAGAAELADQGARPTDAGAAEEFYLRTLAEPALDIDGIETGSPHLQKTVIPVVAEANISIRLAPGQQVPEIAAAFERLLRDAAPAGAELALEVLSAAPAAVVAPHAEALQLGRRAFERTVGVRPALVRSGGTLPVAAALADKGIATIITGFSLPDANIHSPNERLLAEYVPLGISAAGALFEELAALAD
jgi:acetylornithine deacetylase/succinyl-diaminopimelate desuccinylase-like protein